MKKEFKTLSEKERKLLKRRLEYHEKKFEKWYQNEKKEIEILKSWVRKIKEKN